MLLMVRSQGQIASTYIFPNPSPCSWFYYIHFCDLVCKGKYVINCALWNSYSLTENFSKHSFNNRLDGGLKTESIWFLMEASFASGYTARPESPKQEASLHVDYFTAEIFFTCSEMRHIHNTIFDMKSNIKLPEIWRISHYKCYMKWCY